MAEEQKGKWAIHLSEVGIQHRKKAQGMLKEQLKNDIPEQCSEPGCNCMTKPAMIYWQPVLIPEQNIESGAYLYMTEKTLEDEYFFDPFNKAKFIWVDDEDVPTDVDLSDIITSNF